MLSRTLHATRGGTARAFRQHASYSAPVRSLTSSAARSADTVQDIYLKHLREYKPNPPKPGEADQHVHKFAAPAGFRSPEEPNLANELSAYQNQAVEVEGQGEGSGEQQTATDQPDWFEKEENFEEQDRAAEGH